MVERHFGFSREQRIRTRAEFSAVFDRKQRSSAGPLLAFVVPNGKDLTRLGISMSRRVGIAARRNRVKRMVREAFRLQQHSWPRGWDIVVVPRPHDPMPLERYCELLRTIMMRIAPKAEP